MRYLERNSKKSRCYGLEASLQELGSGLTIVEGKESCLAPICTGTVPIFKKMMEQQGNGILSELQE